MNADICVTKARPVSAPCDEAEPISNSVQFDVVSQGDSVQDGWRAGALPSVLHFPISRCSRALTRSAADVPLRSAVSPAGVDLPWAWRNLTGKFRSGLFFPEAEAQRQALAPGLPHHRHPMTADEACAGLVLIAAVLTAVGLLAWVCL